MPATQLELALDQLDQRVADLSNAVIRGEPVSLELCSADLKAMATGLSTLLKDQSLAGSSQLDLKARVVTIKNRMADLRINLFRRSAAVDGALNLLMPSTSPSTYASQSGRYGANGRQTGAFKVLAA
jgi:hypothetical protein